MNVRCKAPPGCTALIMQKLATANGWVNTSEHGWLCPTHSAIWTELGTFEPALERVARKPVAEVTTCTHGGCAATTTTRVGWAQTAGGCHWLCPQHQWQPQGVKAKRGNYVGMPAALMLEEFGSQVWAVWGSPPYLVGSATRGKDWRDVDVRLILSDEDYAAWDFGDPARGPHNGKWASLVMAYSALGRAMTGLPIDFQIQQQSHANERYDGDRFALGMVDLRMAPTPEPAPRTPSDGPTTPEAPW